MYLEDLGSDCHGGMEIIICKQYAVKDVVTNIAYPFVDFGCSDAFTKGDRNDLKNLEGLTLQCIESG